MRKVVFIFASLCLLFASAMSASWAIDPTEKLDDPVLEARARAISKSLRCVVCNNQSIDESNSMPASTLRILIRERLQDGDTDAQVMDYVVSRYGEFVLLKPSFTAKNMFPWFAPLFRRRRAFVPALRCARFR